MGQLEGVWGSRRVCGAVGGCVGQLEGVWGSRRVCGAVGGCVGQEEGATKIRVLKQQ